jgi:hypothetical protein
MGDLAVVLVGGGLAYLAYKQIKTRAADMESFQAGMFRESDLAMLEKKRAVEGGVHRMDYNSEAPDPSLDHFMPKHKRRTRRNMPVPVGPDTKPSIF